MDSVVILIYPIFTANLNKGKSKIHDKQIMPLMNVIVSPPKLKGLTHNTHERLAEER